MFSLIHNHLHIIIYLILAMKIIIIISYMIHLYMSTYIPNSKIREEYDNKILFIKEKSEFILQNIVFIIIIFIFYPRKNQNFYLNKDLTLSLFIYFIIILIIGDWNFLYRHFEIKDT